jgi:hypothetical protein
MRNLLLGAALTCGVFLGWGSKSAPDAVGGSTAAVRTATPLPVGALSLDRAVRIPMTLPHFSNPTIVQFPPTVGFVMTSLKDSGTSGGQGVICIVNGGVPERLRPAQAAGHCVEYFDPPIVVTPGSSLSLGGISGTMDAVIGGYFVYPGEV